MATVPRTQLSEQRGFSGGKIFVYMLDLEFCGQALVSISIKIKVPRHAFIISGTLAVDWGH